MRAVATNNLEAWRSIPVRSASGPAMMPGVSTRDTIGIPKASQNCTNRAALSPAAEVSDPAMCNV